MQLLQEGHLAHKCWKKSRDSHEETRVAEEDTPQNDEFYRMDHVSSGNSAPLYVAVTTNGSPLSMESVSDYCKFRDFQCDFNEISM